MHHKEKIESEKVFINGAEVHLLGKRVEVGTKAHDFSAVDNSSKDVKLSDYIGKKIVVLNVFPSIDTDVCASQTRKFNQMASDISTDVVILSISKDLPFALKRFCAVEGIDRVYTWSDYKFSDFGMEYGFLIKENRLLSRGAIVIDYDGIIRYVEYVKDIVNEPDYKAIMDIIPELLKRPV